MVPGLLPVLEQCRRIVHVVDDEVEVAVVVEIPDGEAASDPGDLQAAAGALRHVTESRAEIEQDLVLLAKGLAELRKLVHIRKDVAVGKEEIELAVQVGVEEGRTPSHARKRRCGDAGGRARVLEVPAVDAVIERVLIVREGGEDEIQATVTVVVAGVHAHARLRAAVTVHGNACGLADFLEASVPEVVVEEVGIRIVGDEQIDQAVIVVVGRHDAEAVRAAAIGETVRVGRFDEPAVADVLEEQVGLARQPGGPDHDVRAVAPDERALRALQRVPRRVDVARDVEVEIAVAVGVEKRAAAAPAASRETRLLP